MELQIIKSGGMVSIKDVSLPASHSKLNLEMSVGGFSCNLSSATNGASPTDTLTIIHDEKGVIGSFTAAEILIPAGATLTVLQPLIMSLLN